MFRKKIQRVIEDPGEAVTFLWRQVFKVFGHREYKQFILLENRTGSNMVRSFLNSHPNIFIRDEIFKVLNGQDYRKTLNSTYSKQSGKIKAVGFKIFYRHPYDDNSGEIWNDLISRPELYVIHLKRRNILRTLLSQEIASKTNIWQATKPHLLRDVHSRLVEFSADKLKEEFEKIRGLEREFDHKFSQHPILVMYYEDLVSNPNEEFRKITDFLNLPFYPPRTQHMRQNPEKPAQLIVNYKQLKKEFLNTEWEHFFEE